MLNAPSIPKESSPVQVNLALAQAVLSPHVGGFGVGLCVYDWMLIGVWGPWGRGGVGGCVGLGECG